MKLTAMKTQQRLMYGLSLSPILANFQKTPSNLDASCQPAQGLFGEGQGGKRHAIPVSVAVQNRRY